MASLKKLLVYGGAALLIFATPSFSSYRVCFTPGQPCTLLLVSTINEAKQSIYVQAYSFTSKPIADSLVAAEHRGVNVFIILDKSQLKQRDSQLHAVFDAHIPIWIDSKVAIAHNKVMIIDGREVVTGSFNFTNSAQERNAENMLIVNDNVLANQYYINWLSRKNKSYKYTNDN